MLKFVKFIAMTVLVSVILLLIAAIAINYFINPNRFKGEISAEIQQKIGRSFEIIGDIHWSFFPSFSIKIEDIVIGNTKGFNHVPLATLGLAAVRIKLLPLLHGKIESEDIVLNHLTLNLLQNATGKNNWHDLMALTTAQSSDFGAIPDETLIDNSSPNYINTSPSNKQWSLHFNTIRLTDTEINWHNLKTDEIIKLKLPSVYTENANLDNDKFPIEIALNIENPNNKLSGNLQAKTELQIDGEQQKITILNLALKGSIKNNQAAQQPITVQLATSGIYDGAVKRLTMQNIDLQINGLYAKSFLQTNFLANTWQMLGTLELPPSDLQPLLHSLGYQLNSANKQLGKNVAANLHFSLSPNDFVFSESMLRFDDTTIAGGLAIKNFSHPAFQFNLEVNQINLADMLFSIQPDKALNKITAQNMTTQANTMTTSPTSAVINNVPNDLLPVNFNYPIQGTLFIQKLMYQSLIINNVDARIKTVNNAYQIDPINADFYGGHYQAGLLWGFQNGNSEYTFQQNISGVNVQPLLQALAQVTAIRGTLDLNSKVTGNGKSSSELISTMYGSANIAIHKGDIAAYQLLDPLLSAYNQYKNTSLSLSDLSKTSMQFSELTATAKIDQGILYNNDLSVQAPLLAINGAGSVNLNTQAINYKLELSLSLNSQENALSQLMQFQDLTGGALPIIITGTWQNPQVKVNYQTVLKRILDSRLGKKISGLGQLLQEDATSSNQDNANQNDNSQSDQQDSTDDEIKKAKKRLKKELKNIFQF